jgi:hypothetical protein
LEEQTPTVCCIGHCLRAMRPSAEQ